MPVPETIKKIDLKSKSITDEQKEKLRQLFPEVFTEDKIDWDRLQLTLGADIEAGKERFGLTWRGKSECFRIIQEPSIGTLKPAKGESVDWDTTENLFIEGDNLETLKLLQKSYYGKVKMIYIDPPYNTGKEFIYPDKYAESLDTYLAYTGQVDAEGKKFSTNTETGGRYHSNWLDMMYPRLFLARNLLQDKGIIFISIGQDEGHNLIQLMNEIFGEENRIGVFIRLMKTGGNKGNFFSPNTEYLLIYAKNISLLNGFRDELPQELIDKVYTQIEEKGPRKGEKYRSMGLFQSYLDERPNQRYWIRCPDGSYVLPPGKTFPKTIENGETVTPSKGDGVWRWTFLRLKEEIQKNNVIFNETNNSPLLDQNKNKANWIIYTKIWLNDRVEEGRIPTDLIDKFENRQSSQEMKDLAIPFEFAKPQKMIGYLMKISSFNKNDLILDFFAGSCSTAHAVLDLNNEDGGNRKFIMIQLPEPTGEDSEASKEGFKTIADIGKERIRRVINKIKEDEKEGTKQKRLVNDPEIPQDRGFRVFKLSKSNFKVWDGRVPTDGKVGKKLEDFIDNLHTGGTDEEILYELLLKSGFALTTPVKERKIAGKTAYSVNDGTLLICLEHNLTKELIVKTAELKPTRVICLDAGFKGNDQLKTNAAEILRSHDVQDFKTV